MAFVMTTPHRAILDIGPGFGKYGVLCREFCDLVPSWIDKKLNGFDQKNWQIKIDCIEPHKDYITTLHKYIYDNIHVGKAEDLIETLPDYDLILMVGVIEHLKKGDGECLLDNCCKKAKSVIVVTPKGFKEQGPEWNNPFEEHLSGWVPEDFKKRGFKVMVMVPDDKIIAYKEIT